MITRWPYPRHGDTPDKINNTCQTRAARLNAKLKPARERMHIIAAYQEVGTYRGAADICGTTHKTVKRVVVKAEAGEAAVVVRAERPGTMTR